MTDPELDDLVKATTEKRLKDRGVVVGQLSPLEKVFYWVQVIAIIGLVVGWMWGCSQNVTEAFK